LRAIHRQARSAFTCGPQPTAEALAVKDGRILAVGARSAIEVSYSGEDTTVVETVKEGRTIYPAR
jgi:predicted amidohydrolase YtcJ